MNDKERVKMLEDEIKLLREEVIMWKARYEELRNCVEMINAERLEEAKRQQEFLYSLLIKKEGE
jgi:predicted nuclease with TOPRIM domain